MPPWRQTPSIQYLVPAPEPPFTKPHPSPMPVFLAFVLYFVGCMLLSALLLPWLQPLLHALFGATPDRALYRFGMLLTFLGLPWLLRWWKLRDKKSLGFAHPRPWRELTRGLGWGMLILGLILGVLLMTGVRQPKPGAITLATVLSALGAGLVSGLAVGLIEEFFFRGALQTGMRRSLAFWPTALLIGLFYAVVHFIRPTPLANGAALNLFSALGMLWGGLGNLAEFADYADSFVALLLAGMLLSLTRERTGSFHFATGLHAGWVIMIRIAKRLSETNHDSPWIFLIGDYDNITGWLAAGVIVLFILIYDQVTRSKPLRSTTH
ncbi:MAG: CPBP family intramembrane metalloprotease [Gammaproteobacteria bacterium]|nr:MAG: CPBP family intramembrane metalloprotease [Gammaproteobacteria bacterium]